MRLACAIGLILVGCTRSSEDVQQSFALAGCDAAVPHLLQMERRAFPLRYRFEETPGDLTEPENWRKNVQAGMRAWSSVHSAVRFVETSGNSEVDLLIQLHSATTDPCGQFGRGTRMAHTGYLTEQLLLHFDAERSWPGESFARTALHELGHVLGLAHDEDPRSILSAEEDDTHAGTIHVLDALALTSLLGSDAPLCPADLALCAADGTRRVLRGILPPGCGKAALFDGDGDGRAELFVWYAAGNRAGALYRFSFGPGLELAKSDGPRHGLTSPAAEHAFLATAEGRWLCMRMPDKTFRVRAFDLQGLPTRPVLVDRGQRIVPSSNDAPHRLDEGQAAGPGVAGELGRRAFRASSWLPSRADVDGDGIDEWLEGSGQTP